MIWEWQSYMRIWEWIITVRSKWRVEIKIFFNVSFPLNHKPLNFFSPSSLRWSFLCHTLPQFFSISFFHLLPILRQRIITPGWMVVSIQNIFLMVKNISKNLLYYWYPKAMNFPYELFLFSHQWNCKPHSLNHLQIIYKLLKNHFSKKIKPLKTEPIKSIK
jgi:hypothetical protein